LSDDFTAPLRHGGWARVFFMPCGALREFALPFRRGLCDAGESFKPMKPSFSKDGPNRFKGPMRHYHRAGAPPERSWEEWIDGKSGHSPGRPRRAWRIIGIILALLALGGIIAGLFIELR
jgi:hypothetical protein